jgi:hypothetical protein
MQVRSQKQNIAVDKKHEINVKVAKDDRDQMLALQ